MNLFRNTFALLSKSTREVFSDCEFQKYFQNNDRRRIFQMANCRKKVSCLPVSAFYNSKTNSDYIRFSFAKKDDLIIDAFSIQKNF
jgi:methionine aminotransferase